MASNYPYNPYVAGYNPQTQVAYPQQPSPPQPAYFTQPPTPPQHGYPSYPSQGPHPAYSPSQGAPNNANSAPQAAGHPQPGYFPGQGTSSMNANFAPPNQFPPSQNTNYAAYQSYGSAPPASKINPQQFWQPQPGSIATPAFQQNPLPPPAPYPIASQTLPQGAPASQFQQNLHVENHYTENHYTTIYQCREAPANGVGHAAPQPLPQKTGDAVKSGTELDIFALDQTHQTQDGHAESVATKSSQDSRIGGSFSGFGVHAEGHYDTSQQTATEHKSKSWW